MALLSGFSKFNRRQRLDYIVKNSDLKDTKALEINDYSAHDQELYNEMIENYIGNFPLPLGVVTNMLINGEWMIVPFVTEESSVIAAAAKAAKFWAGRGGFKATILGTTKKGQIHFTWNGQPLHITQQFTRIREKLYAATRDLTHKMGERGGGIRDIQLVDKTYDLPGYYQIDVSFGTADAMGANFINSCLEKMACALQQTDELNIGETKVDIIMSILSNYTPESLVSCRVECPITKLDGWNNKLSFNEFATKFKLSVDIANVDRSRAVTHNKGIFNGIDAVLQATGNDCRATAAAAHAYASRDGSYKSLNAITLTKETFAYELQLPLSIGTVGGITQIHPVVKIALDILKNPDAQKLMMIAVAAGMASNFAAIASLITSGIQAGHMKMHLSNILNQLKVNSFEKERAIEYFSVRAVSYDAVEDYILNLRETI